MTSYVNPDQLTEIESLAEKLRKLPEAALLYVAGAVEMATIMTTDKRPA